MALRAASSGENGPSNSRLFGETLCRMAKEDDRIVAVTAAMAEGTGLSVFQQQFPIDSSMWALPSSMPWSCRGLAVGESGR